MIERSVTCESMDGVYGYWNQHLTVDEAEEVFRFIKEIKERRETPLAW